MFLVIKLLFIKLLPYVRQLLETVKKNKRMGLIMFTALGCYLIYFHIINVAHG